MTETNQKPKITLTKTFGQWLQISEVITNLSALDTNKRRIIRMTAKADLMFARINSKIKRALEPLEEKRKQLAEQNEKLEAEKKTLVDQLGEDLEKTRKKGSQEQLQTAHDAAIAKLEKEAVSLNERWQESLNEEEEISNLPKIPEALLATDSDGPGNATFSLLIDFIDFEE